MEIRFYNTLTNRLEPFQPVTPPDADGTQHVYMYNCGPTVYDYAHIGNFRAFLFADVLRRFLELAGYTVHQVMNITDVGHMTEDDLADGGGQDKMEKARQRIKAAIERGDISADEFDDPDDPFQIARYYTKAFVEDAKTLGIKVAHDFSDDPAKTQMPRATDHVVNNMIPLIQKLIEKKHAYVAPDGVVYYDVQSFPDYGRLSGNTLENLKGGAGGRVDDANQASKKHPADFLLWKPDDKHLMKWLSPWGEGYPGWHIECSAMAKALLGRDVIDIHTGGEDNIFPHHECEIAQTRGATDESHFAKLWMHTRFLLVEGEKMAKSKGNFYTVRDLMSDEKSPTGRAIDPAVIRYEIIKSHYRKNADFTKKGLEDSGKAVQRIRDFWNQRNHDAAAEGTGLEVDRLTDELTLDDPVLGNFAKSLMDDLNVSSALAVVFEFINRVPTDNAYAAAVMNRIDQVLNVTDAAAFAVMASEIDAVGKCSAIDAARAAKDFAAADAIRAEMIDAGYDVKTTKEGTTATKKLT